MSDEHNEWLESQIEGYNVPEKYRDPITRLVKMGWFFEQNFGMGKEEYDQFLEIVNKLSKKNNIVVPQPDAKWIEAKPGMLVVRDYVRVKADAYSGETGLMHNGKSGYITAIRYGDIHVLYDGAEGANTVRHSPSALEKRIS